MHVAQCCVVGRESRGTNAGRWLLMMMVTPTREAELNLSQTTNCFWSCLLAGGELMGYFFKFLSLFQASSDSAGKGNTHLVLEGLHSKLHFRLQMSKMAFITASTNSLTSRKDVTYKVLTQIKTRILLNITLCDICLKVINNNKTIPGKWIPLNSQHNNIFCLLIARNRSNFTCFGCAHMFIFSSLKTRWNGWLTFVSCFFSPPQRNTCVCFLCLFILPTEVVNVRPQMEKHDTVIQSFSSYWSYKMWLP